MESKISQNMLWVEHEARSCAEVVKMPQKRNGGDTISRGVNLTLQSKGNKRLCLRSLITQYMKFVQVQSRLWSNL